MIKNQHKNVITEIASAAQANGGRRLVMIDRMPVKPTTPKNETNGPDDEGSRSNAIIEPQMLTLMSCKPAHINRLSTRQGSLVF